MDGLDAGPTKFLDPTYGALLIGTMLAILFEGTLIVQAYNYYENFPYDKLRTKITVGLVCVIDTVHTILICKAMYELLITDWGFIGSLDTVPIELGIHLLLTACSCIAVQSYFLERIWLFSHKNILIVLPLVLLAIVPVVLELHLGVLRSINRAVAQYAQNKPEAITIFVSGALSDMLIALVTCYYLRRNSTSFPKTQSVISRAIQLVIGSGLATGFIAIGSAIAFFVRPNALHFVAVHLQLGRTYTNALLATLNARKDMRDMLSESHKSRNATHRSTLRAVGRVETQKGALGDNTNIVCMVSTSQYSDSDRAYNQEKGEAFSSSEIRMEEKGPHLEV
ncbi:hypothetical protein BJ165DRAFT_1616462 [Panaeolus papilionaceus]|nr:hypothetical protein BJ165DRAFT_1616462 [Panaeolus papilionaceus]